MLSLLQLAHLSTCFALLVCLNLHMEAIFWRLFCLPCVILVDVWPVVLNMLLDVPTEDNFGNDCCFPSRLVSSHGLYILTIQDNGSWWADKGLIGESDF